MRRAALVLVHHPVLDREGGTVTTAITNLDIHDMARAARTYGLEALFVIHPIAAQRQLAESIRDHWTQGSGKKRIPDRADALGVVRVVSALADVHEAFGGRDNAEVWTTSAKGAATTTYEEAKHRLSEGEKPVLLLFGTGWGLAREVIEGADVRLMPVRSAIETGYNHLSVRSACSIVLDRLFGDRG